MATRVISSRRVHAGSVIALDVEEVEEPGGVVAVREVVRHPGSVAVLPVYEDGSVVLIQQYRHPAGGLLWELPAGRLEPGEEPVAGAHRELEEEAGLLASTLEPLQAFFTTPGFCEEYLHLFRASGLQAVPQRPEADERIETRRFRLDEIEQLSRQGQLRDAKTLLALLLEERRAGLAR